MRYLALRSLSIYLHYSSKDIFDFSACTLTSLHILKSYVTSIVFDGFTAISISIFDKLAFFVEIFSDADLADFVGL